LLAQLYNVRVATRRIGPGNKLIIYSPSETVYVYDVNCVTQMVKELIYSVSYGKHI